ncbi:MAG: arylsulfatase [Planctomycetes bacterium]|nr:arylsulfatase [Planctomycetota bacterium]
MLRASWCAALAALAACSSLAHRPAADSRAPNVIVVLADDLGPGDPRCYNDESKIATPRIDRLAAEGMRFTDAHAPASVCTPTRYGILTGRYAWRRGLQNGVLAPFDPPLIEPDRTTLPEALRAHGYRTACIGKWHLGWDWPLLDGTHLRDEFDGLRLDADRRTSLVPRIDFRRPIAGGPLAHGFDVYFGCDVPNHPPYAWVEGDRLLAQPTDRNDATIYGHDGPMTPGWDHSAVLPAITQRAAAWIDDHAHAHREQPFFLLFALTAPHTPIAPTSRWSGTSGAGSYGDFVAETDWALGVVLDALARNDLDRDTMVVFTSDNGSPQYDGTGHEGALGSVKQRFGHDPSRPWRGLKGDVWEGGHRVPFVVRWPGRVPAGATSDEPLVLTDLYRTILALAGGAPEPGDAEDSLDFSAAWCGTAPPRARRETLIHHSSRGLFAIRVGPWKLVDGRGSGGFTPDDGGADPAEGQLFDLAHDPGETTNLWSSEPRIAGDLLQRLRRIVAPAVARGP